MYTTICQMLFHNAYGMKGGKPQLPACGLLTFESLVNTV